MADLISLLFNLKVDFFGVSLSPLILTVFCIVIAIFAFFFKRG